MPFFSQFLVFGRELAGMGEGGSGIQKTFIDPLFTYTPTPPPPTSPFFEEERVLRGVFIFWAILHGGEVNLTPIVMYVCDWTFLNHSLKRTVKRYVRSWNSLRNWIIIWVIWMIFYSTAFKSLHYQKIIEVKKYELKQHYTLKKSWSI